MCVLPRLRDRQAGFLAPADRVPVPFDTEPDTGRGHSVARFDLYPAFRDVIELRDELDPARIRHAGAQTYMQFHQEMRTDRNVERLGEMRHLEPRRDAADARNIGLH